MKMAFFHTSAKQESLVSSLSSLRTQKAPLTAMPCL